MVRIDQARHEDACFFQDWSAGRDQHGLWLWADVRLRVLIVRPMCTRSHNVVRGLGGQRQAWHRYDQCAADRDWYIPAARWHAVKAVVPELARLRARYLERRVPGSSLNGVRRATAT